MIPELKVPTIGGQGISFLPCNLPNNDLFVMMDKGRHKATDN